MQAGAIVRVFIASPGDVSEEREEACLVISDWNSSNSLAKAAIVEPVRVETHSQAAQGAHPQDIINGQLLERCDILLAIFWTRIGTETEKDRSGTIQEIREFGELKGDERVLLFFCEREYPNDVDLRGVELVREFRKELQSKGLYKTYKSTSEFQRSFRQQLDLAMNTILSSDEIEQLPVRRKLEIELFPESNTLLVAGSHSTNSGVSFIRTRSGHQVFANNVCYSKGNDARSEARWEAAIEQLELARLLESEGEQARIVSTHKGRISICRPALVFDISAQA